MYMRTSFWIIIMLALLLVIGVLAWILFATPAPVHVDTTTATTTATTSTTNGTAAGDSTDVNQAGSLASRVIVTEPAADGVVAANFTVSGQAPGPWFNEAVFPIKVLDKDGNQIGTGQGQAQGEWMTDQSVAFYAQVTTSGYHGVASLVLMKDNESGLPQNDASVSVPIVIQ